MVEGPPDDIARQKTDLRRFGNQTRTAIAFREEIFTRGPEAIVERDEAADVLGLTREQLDAEVDTGHLGIELADGDRIIRVTDLRAWFDAELARRREVAKGLSQLREKLDVDE